MEKLEQDQHVFQEWLNQFYYPHLIGKVNLQLLRQLSEQNYEQLPSKSVIKLTRVINSRRKPSLGTA